MKPLFNVSEYDSHAKRGKGFYTKYIIILFVLINFRIEVSLTALGMEMITDLGLPTEETQTQHTGNVLSGSVPSMPVRPSAVINVEEPQQQQMSVSTAAVLKVVNKLPENTVKHLAVSFVKV